MAQLWEIGLVIVGTIISAVSPILLKRGSQQFNINIFRQLKNVNIAGGIALYLLGFVVSLPALKEGELSILYAVGAVKYIWVALLSKCWLGEHISNKKWLGLCLIVVGVTVMNL